MMQNEKTEHGRESLLSYGELAEYLGRSIDSLRHDVSTRRIPHVKLFGQVRFRRSEIDEWLEGKKINVRERRR